MLIVHRHYNEELRTPLLLKDLLAKVKILIREVLRIARCCSISHMRELIASWKIYMGNRAEEFRWNWAVVNNVS